MNSAPCLVKAQTQNVDSKATRSVDTIVTAGLDCFDQCFDHLGRDVVCQLLERIWSLLLVHSICNINAGLFLEFTIQWVTPVLELETGCHRFRSFGVDVCWRPHCVRSKFFLSESGHSFVFTISAGP